MMCFPRPPFPLTSSELIGNACVRSCPPLLPLQHELIGTAKDTAKDEYRRAAQHRQWQDEQDQKDVARLMRQVGDLVCVCAFCLLCL